MKTFSPISKLTFLLLNLVLLNSFLLASDANQPVQNNKPVLVEGHSVFLHFDKQNYYAGDIIWFKAYLLTLANNKPVTGDVNIFIELVNVSNQNADELIFKSENGFAAGQIMLSDSLPDGSYFVRAYTKNILENNPELIFSQSFYIHNPKEENYITRRRVRENRRFNRMLSGKQDELVVDIYPETGNLIHGIPANLVVRVANGLQEGLQNVKLELVDNENATIAQTHTLKEGFGKVSFTPGMHKSYTLNVTHEATNTRTQVELPEIFINGATFSAVVTDSVMSISFLTNIYRNDNEYVFSIYSPIDSEKKVVLPANFNRHKLTIPLSEIRQGLNNLVLYDNNQRIVAERLLFVDKAEEDIPIVKVLQGETRSGEVHMTIDLKNEFSGSRNYSLSISSLPKREKDLDWDLYTFFALNSFISTPVSSTSSVIDNKELLDMILIASGFRDSMKEEASDSSATRKPGIEVRMPEYGLSVSGQLVPLQSNLIPGNITVELSLNVDGDLVSKMSETNADGRFNFDKLEFYDSQKVEISLGSDSRNRRFAVKLFPMFPEISPVEIGAGVKPFNITQRGPDWSRTSEYFKPVGAQEESTIQQPLSMYGAPDRVIYADDLGRGINSIEAILSSNFPGLFAVGGSLQSSSEPLFLVDNIVVPYNSFLNVPIHDLLRIEYLRGSSATAFGLRGANGAFLAFTRRAQNEYSTISFDFVLNGFTTSLTLDEDISRRLYSNIEGYPRTITWLPEVPFQNGNANLVFFLEEYSGENLLLTLHGVDERGNITVVREIIEVP